jgi:hypothetical protein
MTHFDLGVRELAGCAIGLALLFTRTVEAQTATQTPAAEQPEPPPRLPRFTDSPAQGSRAWRWHEGGRDRCGRRRQRRQSANARRGVRRWPVGPIWEVHAPRAAAHLQRSPGPDCVHARDRVFTRQICVAFLFAISGCYQTNEVTDECFDGGTSIPRETSFVQLEVGLEMRIHGRWVLRASTGFAAAVGMTAHQCVDLGKPTSCGGATPSDTVFALTTAFGYAF